MESIILIACLFAWYHIAKRYCEESGLHDWWHDAKRILESEDF